MIPAKSTTSIKEGNWYIYHDGGNVIQVWSSNLSGKEKVYLNNELVSEKRSMKMQSMHHFTDKDGQDYEVRFITQSLLKGLLDCEIRKEDQLLKIFKTRYVRGRNFTLKRFLILMLISILFGWIKAVYQFPDFTIIIVILLVMILHLMTREKGEMVIEDL